MDWDDYHYFLQVARAGSLNAAAEKMKVNQSTVFRRINALEEKMDVRLFDRHQTGYSLTEAGEEIIRKVERIDEEMLAIDRTLLGKDIRLSGTIKISTTDTIGYYWLPKHIAAFKERYPDIVLDIDITTRYTNLSKREADIVIPAMNKQPDTMVGRVLSPIIFKLYASQSYIERHGSVDDIASLNNHQILLPNEALAGLSVNQYVRKYVPNSAIVMMSDKLTGLYRFCREGLGIAPLPSYVGDDDPNLTALLNLPESCNNQIWILTHPDLRNTARIKAFMKFMRESGN